MNISATVKTNFNPYSLISIVAHILLLSSSLEHRIISARMAYTANHLVWWASVHLTANLPLRSTEPDNRTNRTSRTNEDNPDGERGLSTALGTHLLPRLTRCIDNPTHPPVSKPRCRERYSQPKYTVPDPPFLRPATDTANTLPTRPHTSTQCTCGTTHNQRRGR